MVVMSVSVVQLVVETVSDEVRVSGITRVVVVLTVALSQVVDVDSYLVVVSVVEIVLVSESV